MPQPFYVTTPIYYVNDAPHIGHAYTTVAADVLARWRRLWGDDVVFLTGTDEHGLKIQRAAEAQGVTPAGVGRPHERAVPRRLGRCSTSPTTDFIRTTEPRHEPAVQEFLQRVYDTGDIELGTYEGLYCVALRGATTPRTSSSTASARSTARPVERVTEENYFFQLSRFEDRLLAHYAAHPEAVQPDAQAQRGARLHQAGPARLLDEPHVDLVGHPAAVGPDARRLRVVRRAVQLLHRGRLRRRPRALRPLLAGRLPPHRQGHPPLPRGVLAGDADGRGRGAAEDACSRTATCSSAARR